jgi:TfoX/Sxy family transcriptional regulator of competence genes
MPYNEAVADRIRTALKSRRGITERKMFGGLCFMLNGHMVCGVLNDDLVLHLGPDAAEKALDRPHVRPMDFTGKPLKSMVYIAPPGFKRTDALNRWLTKALNLAASLPPK